MLVLGVDTALIGCSACLVKDGDVVAFKMDERPSKQAEMLVPMVEEMLAEAGVSYADVDLFASSIGPGSFTGLRIGITAVKGFSLVTEKQSVGVTTLQALALQAGFEVNITSVINAGRGQFYVQNFDADMKPTSEAILVDYRNLADNVASGAVVISNDYDLVKEHFAGQLLEGDNFPTAREVAILATRDSSLPAEPLYIRAPDAKKSC